VRNALSPQQCAAIQHIVFHGGSVEVDRLPAHTMTALKNRGLVIWDGSVKSVGAYVLTDDGKRAAIRIANDARRAQRADERQ
jgi:hypothetical protein